MKIANNLERCGDLAKNIAKRALVIAETEPLTPLTRSIERMGELVPGRLKDVLDAYTARDLERAAGRLEPATTRSTSTTTRIFRELLTYMMGDPRTITACAHLLFVAKNLERIGDHATNIAEILHYEITGDELTERAAEVGRLDSAMSRPSDRDDDAPHPGGRGRGRPGHPAAVQPREGGLRRRASPPTARRRCC